MPRYYVQELNKFNSYIAHEGIVAQVMDSQPSAKRCEQGLCNRHGDYEIMPKHHSVALCHYEEDAVLIADALEAHHRKAYVLPPPPHWDEPPKRAKEVYEPAWVVLTLYVLLCYSVVWIFARLAG